MCLCMYFSCFVLLSYHHHHVSLLIIKATCSCPLLLCILHPCDLCKIDTLCSFWDAAPAISDPHGAVHMVNVPCKAWDGIYLPFNSEICGIGPWVLHSNGQGWAYSQIGYRRLVAAPPPFLYSGGW